MRFRRKSRLISQEHIKGGKLQKFYDDGKKEIIFKNGVKRHIFPNGYTVVDFTNKDIK